MKKFVTVAMIAVMTLGLGISAASAKPKGLRSEDVGKKLFNFNVVVFPGDDFSGDDAVCGNNGHRIFFNEDGAGALGRITWNLVPGNHPNFDITDCDGTLDNTASVVVNESLEVLVAVRLVGPANSSLDLVCEVVVESDNVLDDLCIVDGRQTINKGNSFTRIMENLVDDEFEQVTWDLDNSKNAKILQVWVMELLD